MSASTRRSPARELLESLLATRRGERGGPQTHWVLYRGDYLNYGQIVILDVGQDHTILLAGLEAVSAWLDTPAGVVHVLVAAPVPAGLSALTELAEPFHKSAPELTPVTPDCCPAYTLRASDETAPAG